MKELKIDPEFRDLLPTLSKERFDSLENMILTEGYDGTPILVWNGFIVDGHHRYKIFKKHNIEFNTEEISLPRDSDKSDVMDWMITYQNARRNMNDAEKIYANDKVAAQRIREENEKRKLEGSKLGGDVKNGNVPSDQMDGNQNDKKSHTFPTHTREQRAKMSGVSSGTISRYDIVMKSDDEELKKSMLSGDVKIGTAYKQIVQEKNKTQLSPISVESVTTPKTPKTEVHQRYDEQTKEICEFMKTERKADFNYDIVQDITSLHLIFEKKVEEIKNSIFMNQELMNNLTEEHSKTIVYHLKQTKDKIQNIIESMEEKYEK